MFHGCFSMAITYYRFPILWALFILILIGLPGNFVPQVPKFIDLFSPDKIIHLFLFATLSFLLMRSLYMHKANKHRVFYILITLTFGIIYGVSTELLQFFVFIGRNANPFDALANIIGVILGIILFFKGDIFFNKKINIDNK